MSEFRWWPDALKHSPFWIATFTFFTMIFIGRQVKASHDIERGWVLVKSVSGPSDGKWFDHATPRHLLQMVAEIRIFGKTPVRIRRTGVRFHLVKARAGAAPPEPDLPRKPDYKCSRPNPEIPLEGRIAASDEIIRVEYFLEDPVPLDDQSWIKICQGELFICAYGLIEYDTVIGFVGRRRTKFCYVWTNGGAAVVQTTDGKSRQLIPSGFRLGGPPQYNVWT